MQWRPYGRELKVFDDSTAKMQDTSANQVEYPQVKNQRIAEHNVSAEYTV